MGFIIGLDFRSFCNLFLDVRHWLLIDNITRLTVNGVSARPQDGHIKVLAVGSCYHAPLQDFEEIIRPVGTPRETRTLLPIISERLLNHRYLIVHGA